MREPTETKCKLLHFVIIVLVLGTALNVFLGATLLNASALNVVDVRGGVEQVSTCSQAPGIAVTPCSTTSGQPSAVYTDWAVLSVSLSPSSPSVGDSVAFSMVVSALSSTGPFPQDFTAACSIDGASCGVWTVTYPGPMNTPYTVSTQTPWIATSGTHTLEWAALTIPLGLNPNPSNNHLSQTFTVAAQASFDFSLSATPTQQSIVPGGSTSFAVNVALVSGSTQNVSLSLSGQPGGVNASLTPNSGTPSFGSTLTVTASSSAIPGNYTLMITGSGGGRSHSTNVLLAIIAPVAVSSSSSAISSSSSASVVSSAVPTSGLVTPVTAGVIGVIGIIAGIGVGYGVSKLRTGTPPGSTPSTPTNPPGSTSGPPEPAMDCATLMQTMNSIGGWQNVLLNLTIPALEQSVIGDTRELAYVLQQISPSGIPAQIAGLVAKIKSFKDMQTGFYTAAAEANAVGQASVGAGFWGMAKALDSVIGQLQGQETSLQTTLTTDQGLASSLPKLISSLNSQITAANKTVADLQTQWNQFNAIWMANCEGSGTGGSGGANAPNPPPQIQRNE